MNIPIALAVPLVVLLVTAGWDLRTREIPHAAPIALLMWALVSRLAGFQEADWMSAALGLSLGLAIGLGLFALGVLGAGDGKLLSGLGAVIGPVGLLVTLPWISLAGGVAAIWARRRARAEVVYGPAIAVGYGFALCI